MAPFFKVVRCGQRQALKLVLYQDCGELVNEFEKAQGLPADALSND